MSEVIKLYKNHGETPLECLERFRDANPEYRDSKMTYLGRLDPMAEGLLLALVGSVREKERYLRMDKAYEFEVLWGFETDTFDILGLVSRKGMTPEKLEFKMGGLLKKISKKRTQSYPLFSSKVFKNNYLSVRGVGVGEIEVPEKSIKIFNIEHIHTRLVSGKEILQYVSNGVALVKGDFRQKEIMKKWSKELGVSSKEGFLVSKFRADVSSGTYVRSLAQEMGRLLGTSALAFSIKRTRVGEYELI